MGEMWKVFIKVGRVIQVFIARKRDFKGRRFGFVRFLEVKDPKAVENHLNSITIGQYTLQANLARFSKDEAQRKKVTNKVQLKKHEGSTGSSGMQRRGTRTYAEVVRSGQREMIIKERPSWEWKRKDREGANKAEKEGWYGLEFGVEDEDIRELEKCFIGHAKCPEIISTLQDKFAMEGYFLAKITPMGSNLVLLSSGDTEELKHLVTEGRDWLAQWFTEVKPWSPEVVATERFTWLRCQGVPIQIWKSNFFETIACMFGKFISLDGSTIKKSRLDVAKILILTPQQENITKVLKIKVRNQFFSIRISEEVGVDNIFSLRPDFVLCRNEDSSSESWSEGSNWSATNEVESWNQWEVVEAEKGIEQRNKGEQSRWPETSPAATEFECGLEMLEKSDRAINEERQTSNQHGIEGPEENDMMNRWGNESQDNEGQIQLTSEEEGGKSVQEDPYPPGFGPNQRVLGLSQEDEPMHQSTESKSVEPQEQRAFNVNVDKGKEIEAVEYSCVQGEFGKDFEDLVHSLASDDEIFQSKMERIARQRKTGKKKVKQRRLTTRRKAHPDLESELHLRKKRLIAEKEIQMDEGVTGVYQVSKNSIEEEATEIWRIGNQLGLVAKNN
ncbi:hypothetical protein SLEP1_g33844 [Rubroshorea leprosula]|uniref:RRM domain-containing protein n=1 Tax=Rubroshorea leprosula TaxID=152421 RepID=A0AAV5KI77_9ROSI|nr:hypothetical protein SLEP1_g33844 [Rubroshorea leprosula]